MSSIEDSSSLIKDLVDVGIQLGREGNASESSFILREIARLGNDPDAHFSAIGRVTGSAAPPMGMFGLNYDYTPGSPTDPDVAATVYALQVGLSSAYDASGFRPGGLRFKTLKDVFGMPWESRFEGRPTSAYDFSDHIYSCAYRIRNVDREGTAALVWAALALDPDERIETHETHVAARSAGSHDSAVWRRLRQVSYLVDQPKRVQGGWPAQRLVPLLQRLSGTLLADGDYRSASRIAVFTAALRDDETKHAAIEGLEEIYLRSGTTSRTTWSALQACRTLMLNNYPAVAAEMYDSTLLDLAGDGRVAVAKESMAHLKNLVFDSPAEIQEVASPRWGTHSESTTGRHVRARLTDQNSNPQLAVSIGPADYSVSMATVPFLEPAWAGLEYLDLYVSATCSTLAIHPPWQECRLPRIGVMDPVIFDVTATAEGPWSVSLSFYNAGDLRLVEQVTVELPSEVLRVEPSGSDRLA